MIFKIEDESHAEPQKGKFESYVATCRQRI